MSEFVRGYPGLSAEMDSDTAFVMFRRFGKLRIRNLLYKQDRLTELERKLYYVDVRETDFYNLVSKRWDDNEDRKQLMEEIDKALKDYGIKTLSLHI